MDFEKIYGKLKIVEGKTFNQSRPWKINTNFSHYKNCVIRNYKITGFPLGVKVLENCIFEDCILTDFMLSEMHIVNSAFNNCDLSWITFTDINLINVTFNNCDEILEVYITNCETNNVTFIDCEIVACRMLSGPYGNEKYKFINSNLRQNYFTFLDLSKSTFDSCYLSQTVFSNCLFSKNTILENNGAPDDTFCSLDLHTIESSESINSIALKKIFGITSPDVKEYVKDLVLEMVFQSVFISYSYLDRVFANTLHAKLTEFGVYAFLFEKDAPGGKRLTTIMEEGVNSHDRLLFIASENSIKSKACQSELTHGRIKQEKTWDTIFFPIHIDNYLFEVKKNVIRPTSKQEEYWENIQELRTVNSMDFSEFTKQPLHLQKFETKVKELINELRKK